MTALAIGLPIRFLLPSLCRYPTDPPPSAIPSNVKFAALGVGRLLIVGFVSYFEEFDVLRAVDRFVPTRQIWPLNAVLRPQDITWPPYRSLSDLDVHVLTNLLDTHVEQRRLQKFLNSRQGA